MGVGSAISKMFSRQFRVPTPGATARGGGSAQAARDVDLGKMGQVSGGTDRPDFLPTSTQLDKRIAKLEKDDNANKLSAQDKADLKALIKYRNKKDADAANRQASRDAKGRQNQSEAQKRAAAKRKEDRDGYGFDQETGAITNKKKFMALTQNQRDALQRSALILRSLKKKDAPTKLALQGSKAEKKSPINLSKTPSRLSRGGSVGQANSRFGKRDYRKGGMILSTKKKK